MKFKLLVYDIEPLSPLTAAAAAAALEVVGYWSELSSLGRDFSRL